MEDRILISNPSTPGHFQEMIDLQKQNLTENISEEELRSQGLVTVVHTPFLLKKMNHPYPHIIALYDQKIIGYVLVMLNDHQAAIPILNHMYQKLETLKYQGKDLSAFNYFIMGQVCISKVFRGLGIFQRMYKRLKLQMQNDFDFVITEVALSNPRSLKAHYNSGFEVLHRYKDQKNETWEILVWSWI